MLKSKHSGWTFAGTRTPFGGGGGIGNGFGIGDALASIDPGPAIGSGLAEVDTFVNREIPGGWYTVGLAAAGGTALYFAPEIMAAVGAEAGTAITTEAGQAAFFDALASGATSTEAVSAGLGADALAAGAGAGTAAELAGPTYGELGVTGVEGGMAGPTYGELGYTGLNQAEAIAAADAAAQGGLSAKDVLTNANRLKSIAKLLTGSETTPIYGKNVPTASQWQQQAAQNLAQATPEQFGGLYRMNQNPFSFGTQGQTVASPGMYDVSGSMANALRKA
jgi:hypothetical protein